MSDGFTADDVPNQTGRTFLVTGANTGLGYEVALVLALRGARVLMGCRNEDKARKAMARISADVSAADLQFIPLDQGDLSSVRAAAEKVTQEQRLDVLVNNAGIMTPPLQYTSDGFESQFGVNHLGTFLLTNLLLPKLAEQDDSRVVVTSSIAHRDGKIHFDDLPAHDGYDAMARYRQSKLANILFMYELDRRLKAEGSSTIAVGCHPGIADTELFKNMPTVMKLLTPLAKPFFNSAASGAFPTLMAATAPGVEGGDYYGPSKRGETAGPAAKAKSTDTARNPDLAKRLWDVSAELTGL